MQPTFILGPAGSGKTHRCLVEIRDVLKGAPDGLPMLFIAPRQSTLLLERQLLSIGVPGFTRLEILSFDRLAEHEGTLAPCLKSEADANAAVQQKQARFNQAQQDFDPVTLAAFRKKVAMIKEFGSIQFCIFDEPTYGVDADSRKKLAEAVVKVQEATRFDQLLLVSHDDAFEGHVENTLLLKKTAAESSTASHG